MINSTLILKIRQIVRYFETGKVTGADYGAIAIFNDGPGNRKQITYGASQTTEYGNLPNLIVMYAEANGKYAAQFNTFKNHLGKIDKSTLADVPTFIQLLKDASKDPIMQQTQDRFFNLYYMAPAIKWFNAAGLTLPLSFLVIYDSFVHSGSIMEFLRNKFSELTPANGGDEKKWITSYVNVRDEWLENNTSRPVLQATDYRTDSFIHAIRENNWELDKPFTVVNYKTKEESDKPVAQATIA